MKLNPRQTRWQREFLFAPQNTQNTQNARSERRGDLGEGGIGKCVAQTNLCQTLRGTRPTQNIFAQLYTYYIRLIIG